jgi:hypothetical protein
MGANESEKKKKHIPAETRKRCPPASGVESAFTWAVARSRTSTQAAVTSEPASFFLVTTVLYHRAADVLRAETSRTEWMNG